MSKQPDHSYINDNGKLIAGTAAHLNYVFNVKGGVQNYNDEVGAEYIKDFVRQRSNNINSELTAKAKRNRFKAL